MTLLEIRTYKLRHDCSERFIAAMRLAIPLVLTSGMDVVAFGRSTHEHESYYLIRAYADHDQLKEQQDAFYRSDAWRKGPRESVVHCLEGYLNTLVWLSEQGVEDLRANNDLGASLFA